MKQQLLQHSVEHFHLKFDALRSMSALHTEEHKFSIDLLIPFTQIKQFT